MTLAGRRCLVPNLLVRDRAAHRTRISRAVTRSSGGGASTGSQAPARTAPEGPEEREERSGGGDRACGGGWRPGGGRPPREGSLGVRGASAGPRRTRLWEGKEESGWVGGALRACTARRASEPAMSNVKRGHIPRLGSHYLGDPPQLVAEVWPREGQRPARGPFAR